MAGKRLSEGVWDLAEARTIIDSLEDENIVLHAKVKEYKRIMRVLNQWRIELEEEE